jgi:HTH-type transcriptional regulator/antitoxin HigA
MWVLARATLRASVESLAGHRNRQAVKAGLLAEVERLWGSTTATPDGDRLDILATLIDTYDAEHVLMDPPDPVEAIRFRMEQQGLTRKDLEPILGTRTRVTEVLNHRRGLSIGMIRRLHEQLGIAADVLIRESEAISGHRARPVRAGE